MLLWAGLGNPGGKYAGNRHNIGFMAMDTIQQRHGFSPWRSRFQGQASEGTINGEKVLLLKPQTYMNESGRSVGEAMRFLKVALKDVIAFHDELDLAAGKVRLKLGGGNAGHNGLRSMTAHCGNDYRRVRLGIGHPGDKALVHAYVLNDFAKAEAAWVDDLMRIVADQAALLAVGNDTEFQSRIALEMQKRGHDDVKPAVGKPSA